MRGRWDHRPDFCCCGCSFFFLFPPQAFRVLRYSIVSLYACRRCWCVMCVCTAFSLLRAAPCLALPRRRDRDAEERFWRGSTFRESIPIMSYQDQFRHLVRAQLHRAIEWERERTECVCGYYCNADTRFVLSIFIDASRPPNRSLSGRCPKGSSCSYARTWKYKWLISPFSILQVESRQKSHCKVNEIAAATKGRQSECVCARVNYTLNNRNRRLKDIKTNKKK